MNTKANRYTIMIIPERNGGKTISVRMSRVTIILMIVLIAALMIAACFLMYKSAEAAKKLTYFYTLKNNNENLMKENSQLRYIHQKIGRIDTISSYLEKLSAITTISIKNKAQTNASESYIREKTSDTIKTANNIRNATDKKRELAANEKNSETVKISDQSIELNPIILPVDGWITQQFNDDTTQTNTTHPGIDIAAEEGVNIKAPAPGTVFEVKEDQYYGNMIVIKHDNGLITRYGHCAKVFVAQNEKVERGQTIAVVGNTGHSTAPHLHYELIRNGKNINPMEFISSRNK
jgi:murein DD-endopeptidase MepM/ murein hydrolase activator NlpD